MTGKRARKSARMKRIMTHVAIKTYLIFVAPLFMLLLTSCNMMTFTEYRGPNVVEGKGGTVRVVDGIDFWENGEPDRKYKILGVIDDSRGGIWKLSGDGAIAKLARERGGGAVILISHSREFQGIDLDSGDARYRSFTKFVVAEYVP